MMMAGEERARSREGRVGEDVERVEWRRKKKKKQKRCVPCRMRC